MLDSVIIHIGTEKTGSSAIQKTGQINRSVLRRYGVLFPRTPGSLNHVGLPIAALDSPATNRLRHSLGFPSAGSLKEYRDNFRREFTLEIEKSDCNVLVCSNEHLSSRLFERGSLEFLSTFFRPISRQIQIVVYMRPQHEYVASLYSTRVKMGLTKSVEETLPNNKDHKNFNYEKLLDRWADVFGRDSIVPRIFQRDQLLGGDVSEDFFRRVVGLPEEAVMAPSGEVNLSLDSASIEFLRMMNAHLPVFVGDQLNPSRGHLAAALSRASFGPKFALRPDQAGKILDLYSGSNANVARRYFNREDGVLFQNVALQSGGQEAQLSLDVAIKIAAEMWSVSQRRRASQSAVDHGAERADHDE